MELSIRTTRYTVEQVLRGIQAFVESNCGRGVVISPDASVLRYQKAAADSHECPLLFLEDMARYFGLEWGERRWIIWLKLRDRTKTKAAREAAWQHWQQEIGPTILVRDLAQLIAARAVAPTFEPATVLGRRCAAAGVFLGICSLPEVGQQRLPPSAPLRTLGRSSTICQLWKRAEWISGAPLPAVRPASVRRLTSLADWLKAGTFGAAIAIVIACCLLVDWPLCMLVGGVFGCLILWAGCEVVDHVDDPLPAHVRTFGDLAKLIAASRTAVTIATP